MKILAVDDEEGILSLYQDLLCKDDQSKADENDYLYELRLAKRAKEALELFKSFQPDIIILDVYLSGSTGLEVCRQIRQQNRYGSYVGIIFVTGEQTPELTKMGLELGADDFCHKAETTTELLARIRSVIRTKKMADSLKLANEKLRAANERLAKITITDDLTNLYNMRYFKRRLNQEYVRAERYKKFLSLIMLDVDHFKQINDHFDHLMGSYVLGEIGRLIATSIRSLDIAARYGGDEYVIILPETAPKGAYTMAERIRSCIANANFDNGTYQAAVTISLGVATLGPSVNFAYKNSMDLIRAADRFMYEAKASGRGCTVDMNTTFRYADIDVLSEKETDKSGMAS